MNIVEQISGKFHLHPLGFFYVARVIDQSRSIRLHVWLEDGAMTDNDYHNHSFDFNSRIIRGAIQNEIFEFREDRNGSETEFLVSYGNGHSEVNPSGRKGRLIKLLSFTNVAGSEYFLSSRAIHRASPIITPLVTLLSTDQRNTAINVYGPNLTESAFERRTANADEAEGIRRALEGNEAVFLDNFGASK